MFGAVKVFLVSLLLDGRQLETVLLLPLLFDGRPFPGTIRMKKSFIFVLSTTFALPWRRLRVFIVLIQITTPALQMRLRVSAAAFRLILVRLGVALAAVRPR